MSETKNHQIMRAQIDWSDQSEPFSPHFCDLYFNTDQGIDESHYAFIEGNQLIKRWKSHDSAHFCIAETGFGSGLNLLLTCLVFEEFLINNPASALKKLFFSSFEQSPLSLQDLQLAVQKWPSLSPYATPLLAQYPLALTGCHRIHIGHVCLDLWLGDVNDTLPSLYHHQGGLFDCWYLDGLALSKNSDMCNDTLFALIAASCKPQATLTIASATVAVNQRLQAAGFEMTKRKDDTNNGEMLMGALKKNTSVSDYGPHYRPSQSGKSKEIAIIGGGISSACLTVALIERGYQVTLYCKDDSLGCGASGNQQGALYPLLNKQHDALSQFFANSFLYARHYIESMQVKDPFDFDFSGLLQLYYDDHARLKLDKIANATLPTTLVEKISASQTDQLAQLDIGQDALFYPLAGWVSPQQMVNALFAKANKTGQLTVKLNQPLRHFKAENNGWLCDFGEQQVHHDLLLLTTAMHTLDFKQCEALPLSAARGQVTHISSNTALKKLTMTLCHEGYLTPMNQGMHCMGATFKRHSMDQRFVAQEQNENKEKLAKCIKNKPWVEQIDTNHTQANVGIRCTTRDHFPYMGALPDYAQTKRQYQQAHQTMPTDNAPFHDNLFILTGLGSRGLNTAPLLAETLASQINKEPLPLSLPILNAMQCNRQWINYLKKGKELKF